MCRRPEAARCNVHGRPVSRPGPCRVQDRCRFPDLTCGDSDTVAGFHTETVARSRRLGTVGAVGGLTGPELSGHKPNPRTTTAGRPPTPSAASGATRPTGCPSTYRSPSWATSAEHHLQDEGERRASSTAPAPASNCSAPAPGSSPHDVPAVEHDRLSHGLRPGAPTGQVAGGTAPSSQRLSPPSHTPRRRLRWLHGCGAFIV